MRQLGPLVHFWCSRRKHARLLWQSKKYAFFSWRALESQISQPGFCQLFSLDRIDLVRHLHFPQPKLNDLHLTVSQQLLGKIATDKVVHWT
jgi:hypothetical protein